VKPLERMLHDAIGLHGGKAAAQHVERDGVERLHEHVDGPALVRIAEALVADIEPWTRDLLRDALAAMGMRARFWFDPFPKVRVHVPHATATAEREVLAAYAKRRGDGKVTPHDPHRDSWHGCPTNSVNLWVSLGRSRRDNGMAIFPELYGKRVDCIDHSVVPAQYFGRGVDTELAPGDAWMFAGDHLHTSIVNVGPETRVGVSFRLTLGRPRVRGPDDERFVSSRWAGSPLAGVTTRVDARLAQARRRAHDVLGRWLAPLRGRGAAGESALPSGFLAPLAPGLEGATSWEVPSTAIAPGEVRPLHRGVVVWRSASGRVHAGKRICPHRGADLAAGEVCGEQLRCPWHRLALGGQAQPPPGLALHTLPCEEKNGRVVILSR
jgi:nitrite reductase/ring-hydroxylating ferredoxin subunit